MSQADCGDTSGSHREFTKNDTYSPLGMNGCDTGERRHTDPDDSEKTCGCILDGLLHIFCRGVASWSVGGED